ncbi:alanine racemase, partial [Acinetobacter baumannii]
RLAEALDRVGEKAGMRLKVLVEVNLGREPRKHGFLEEELPEALARIREMEHLSVLGLMTVPPMGPEAVVRPIFRRLSELADRYGL